MGQMDMSNVNKHNQIYIIPKEEFWLLPDHNRLGYCDTMKRLVGVPLPSHQSQSYPTVEYASYGAYYDTDSGRVDCNWLWNANWVTVMSPDDISDIEEE